MILAFAHPCLVVDDLERAREFYCRMFAFKVLSNESWAGDEVIDQAIGVPGSAARGCMLAGHNCFLELFEYQSPPGQGPGPQTLGPQEPGLRHLAFYVDDCRAEYDRALTLGAQPLGKPPPMDAGFAAVYMRDPFGNIFELCEITDDNEHPVNLPGVSCLNGEA